MVQLKQRQIFQDSMLDYQEILEQKNIHVNSNTLGRNKTKPLQEQYQNQLREFVNQSRSKLNECQDDSFQIYSNNEEEESDDSVMNLQK
mmetsp:Transcript_26786/g.25812  ORF Transcript_26786/g.25812 Transcript_26786/m.25812 type:complete len:89 (-) Transcript_26786:1341-1607(-)